jgi:hypothetical protein
MKGLRKLVLLAGILALYACASGQYGNQPAPTPAEKAKVDCSTVRCQACPEGQTPALKPPDCCRCVPIDTNVKDCSNVRCAACPEGQHPSLQPPDCCRCVPD